MTSPRTLIACIGNIFLGDDGFGVEVARKLAARSLPPEVILKDFGIRAFDLTYALLDPYDLVILVDACPRGGEPGAVYLIEPDPVEASSVLWDAHSLNPKNVLHTVRSMGGAPNRILIVGCEPAELGSDDEGKLGLSGPVAAAVDEAADLIETLVSKTQEREKQMSMELIQHTNGQDANESRDTLFLLGGAAMVVFGAGLILSTPAIRRYLGGMGIGNLIQAAVPDIERYMKLRAM